MLWIETSLPLNFGCEDDGEDVSVRFRGWYSAAHGPLSDAYGDIYEPASSATFEVCDVEWKLDGKNWKPIHADMLTNRLDAQLQRIGVAETEGRIESDRDDAADMRRKERMEERRFGVAAE